MADWVTNGLKIEGPFEDILKVKLQLGRAFTRELPLYRGDAPSENQTREVTFSNPIFSLWNIINPFTEGTSLEGQKEVSNSLVKYDSEWFEESWGTVADVAVADGDPIPTTLLNVETDTSLSYQFDTAWSDCRKAIGFLATLYPSLLIAYDYEYPGGEGGSISFAGKKMKVIEEYRWKCPWCDFIEKGEPPEACPECGETNEKL